MALIKDLPEDVPSTDVFAQPHQGALIEAAVVKFTGNSGDLIDNPPNLDEERTYYVKAKCTKQENTRRDDGEIRTTVTMKLTEVYERGKVPIVDENQPSMFGAAENGDDEPEVDPDA